MGDTARRVIGIQGNRKRARDRRGGGGGEDGTHQSAGPGDSSAGERQRDGGDGVSRKSKRRSCAYRRSGRVNKCHGPCAGRRGSTAGVGREIDEVYSERFRASETHQRKREVGSPCGGAGLR